MNKQHVFNISKFSLVEHIYIKRTALPRFRDRSLMGLQ